MTVSGTEASAMNPVLTEEKLAPVTLPVVDLQWFAAEDEGRTEQPSEHKLRKAREEGRIAKSQEITGALVMLLPVICLIIFAPYFFDTCVEVMRYFIDHCTVLELNDPNIYRIFLISLAKIVGPVAICALIGAIAGNLIQIRGFIFTTKPIQPQFNKIIPKFGEWLKRTLFSAQGVFNLVKSIGKVAIIFIAAYMVIKGELPKLLTLNTVPLQSSVTYIAGLVAKLLIIATVVFLIISIPDYLVQRHEFMEQMKMTKQEVKEEFKEMEGDPYTKGKLRQYMNQLMTGEMRKRVAEADVVITNPTHYAVAIQYDRETMPAPMVVAKGVDGLAQRIKQIARENDVEIVENKPLARALYAEVEIGDIIPEQYYSALSLILTRVYQMKGRM